MVNEIMNPQNGNLKKINKKILRAYPDFGGLIKHAARYLLWLPEAKLLKIKKNRHLKYFTLPGSWAWDIFFFEKNGIIQKDIRGFPGVRFCDNNPKSYTDAVKILGNTVGINASFENIVLNREKVFWDKFPFDIYNLDFCGTCLPDDQPPFSRTFQAIENIIQSHVDENYFPFTIFLTMKALDGETNTEAKEQLLKNIENNRNNDQFKLQINNLIPDSSKFIKDNFSNFIIVSIPKFICHLSTRHCVLEIKERAKYVRHDDDKLEYHIAKFVFRFERKALKSLEIENDNYITNVRSVMRLDNIKIIDESCIDSVIRVSHSELKKCIEDLRDS